MKRPFATRTTLGTGEEVLEEGVQGALSAVVQNAILDDYPHVDPKKAFLDNISPEVAFASLFMRLPAAGAGTWHEAQLVRTGMKSFDMVRGLGLNEEDAREVNRLAHEGKYAEAERLMHEKYDKLSPEQIVEGARRFQRRLDEIKQAVQQQQGDEKVDNVNGEWVILGKDGSIVAQFGDDERAANETLMQRVMWRAEREERARDSSVSFLIQYFDALGHGLKIEDLPGEVMSAEDGSLNMEAFKASLIRHGLDAGLDPTQVIILGENFQELVDGVYQDTIRLYKGRNVWTVIEEVGEALFKRALRNGIITEEEAKEWTKGWAQTSGFRLQDPDNPTMAEATEAVSQMFEAAFLARRKEMPNSPKLFGLMRMGSEYLRQALTRAKQLTEMRDSGQLSESAETFLAQALGIDEQIELNEKTLEGMQVPAGAGVS